MRSALAVLGILGILGRWAWAQTPSATPAPGPLVLDVDRHVDRVLAEDARKGTPRFETSIEVIGKSPQVMLERFFGGVDLECAPAGVGAASEVEMRAVRPHPSPYADFLALGRILAEKLRGKGKEPERYFLYRVRGPEGVSHLLREEPVPPSWLQTLPGTTYELVATFPDVGSAVRGWKRMERGFSSPVAPSASPPPPWQTATCRPRR